MDEGDGALIVLLLVEELVLDSVEVDEVAHAGAGVPADVLGVDIDLAQELDHLVLVGDVGLGTRGGGSNALLAVMGAINGSIDGREREAVGDLQGAVDVHADERAGCGGGEGLGAVLDHLHDHKGLDLDRAERRLLENFGHGVWGLCVAGVALMVVSRVGGPWGRNSLLLRSSAPPQARLPGLGADDQGRPTI